MKVGTKPFAGIKKLTIDQRNRLRTYPSSFSPKDGACVGCCAALALRLVSSAINFEADRTRWKDRLGKVRTGGLGVMLTEHTGCMQIVMTTQDTSAWMATYPGSGPRSMIHNSFSDGTSTLIGTHLAYLSRVRAGMLDIPFYFWSFGGDGAATIGAGQISSFFQQGWGLLVIYDNRGYMNTGGQVSATTFPFENRTTTPLGSVIPGNQFTPRDLIRTAAAHDVPFAATASVARPDDLMEKVRYAINVPGPTIIWIDTPCPKEQGFGENKGIEIAKLALETGLFPLVRYQYGLWAIDYLRSLERTGKPVSLSEYFRTQAKSEHLTSPDFNEALQFLTEQTNRRYAWFLDQIKLQENKGLNPPSLYLPDGAEEPVRSLEEF